MKITTILSNLLRGGHKCLMNMALTLAIFAGMFTYLHTSGTVKAAYTTTSGYQECSVLWPNFPNNTICYARGTYLPWGGWNVDAQCNMTNKIDYGGGHVYYFCDPQNTAILTNKEVIVFVKWNANQTFTILQSAEFSAAINQPQSCCLN